MNESEQAAVIRRCQAGDKEAFRALAGQYETILFSIAYLMTRDRDLAADAVQEALLKLWQHLPTLRDENRLKSWLARILVNEVKQHVRKKRVPTVYIDDAPELPQNSDRMEMDVERDELRETVRKALRMLPDQQQQAVVLRYFGGLSITETAFAMGCREGTVKSRLNRALGSLEEILRGDGATYENKEVLDR